MSKTVVMNTVRTICRKAWKYDLICDLVKDMCDISDMDKFSRKFEKIIDICYADDDDPEMVCQSVCQSDTLPNNEPNSKKTPPQASSQSSPKGPEYPTYMRVRPEGCD